MGLRWVRCCAKRSEGCLFRQVTMSLSAGLLGTFSMQCWVHVIALANEHLHVHSVHNTELRALFNSLCASFYIFVDVNGFRGALQSLLRPHSPVSASLRSL
jgi:hypothetical protein